MFTRLIAKAVIVSPRGNILALRRSKTDVRRPLQWDLPGGLCEENEEPRAAAIRETEEEAAVSVSEIHLRFAKAEIRSWADSAKEKTENVVFLFFVGKSRDESVQLSHEHSEYQWMKIDTALSAFEYPLQKEALTYLRDNQLLELP